jgi:hypothetical protein
MRFGGGGKPMLWMSITARGMLFLKDEDTHAVSPVSQYSAEGAVVNIRQLGAAGDLNLRHRRSADAS